MKELVEIQYKLKVPKGNFNSFGKYKYRSAEDILEAVKPILHEYGANLVLTDTVEAVGDKLFLKAEARLTMGDNHVSVNGYAQMGEHKGMSSEQTTGTASSYARKYALNGLFLIDETEQDADYNKTQEKLDDQRAIDLLSASNTLLELKANWEKLNPREKAIPSVLTLKDTLKGKLQ